MTTHYKTQAFVFKKTDRNESDRVFSVFSDNFGRLEIFAKAIRKSASKLRSGISIFSFSEIEFIQGKNKKTLTEAVIIEQTGLSKELGKFKTANAIAEVLDNFIKGEEKDQNIYKLIKKTFYSLEHESFSENSLRMIYYFFLWNLLSFLGYKPHTNKCNVCHDKLNPYNIYFSSKLGGVICKGCIKSDNTAVKINSDTLKVLRLALDKDWQIFKKLKIGQNGNKMFKKISNEYYLYMLSTHSSVNNGIINTI
jgi:DNA repair protein RecO (recombination protein O)